MAGKVSEAADRISIKVQKDITPEEETLSAAKERQDKPGEAGVPGLAAKGGGSGAARLLRKIDEQIVTALKSDFFKNWPFDPRSLKAFNKYIVIAAGIVSVYLIADILFVNPSRKAASAIAEVYASGTAAPMSRRVTPIDAKTYSYYSGRIGGKNIFAAGANVQSESSADVTEGAGEDE
mgnify:CR=1 FL=1